MASTFSARYLAPYMTATNIVGFTIGFLVLHYISSCIYSVYFHPLSSYPGPKLAAMSQVWIEKQFVSGTYHKTIKALHDKYGDVVRTGPNQLSYSSATSWKDIYGTVGGRKRFLKSTFYDDERAKNIGNLRDPDVHGPLRRLLSHGFSAKALSEQESLVQRYIDQFISQINVHGTGPEGAQMVKWFNCMTFDIIGDLAFGDPFGSLNDGKPHFWISNIFNAIKAGIWMLSLNKNPILKALIPRLLPKSVLIARNKHFKYSRDKMERRLKSDNPRTDLLSGLVMKQNTEERLTLDELESNGSFLIVAGSETTASLLSGLSYLLCKNQSVLEKLITEIRGSFKSYDDINGINADHLTYVKAVLNEGLRLYPPVPIGLPRYSPGETVDGKYVPAGVEVMTSSWAAARSEENFHRPSEFLPERWTDPECKDKKHASQPFLLGSRVCLGRNLAMMEMTLTLCKLLWVYDMELLNPDQEWVEDSRAYGIWQKPDLNMRFTRRSGVIAPPIDG